MTVDVSGIKEINSLIEEVNEVIGVWEIWIEDCPVNPIRVKVLRLHPQDRYMGVANYSIQNPEQGNPYRSMRQFESISDALEDAIRGFLMFYEKKLKDKTKFVLDVNF